MRMLDVVAAFLLVTALSACDSSVVRIGAPSDTGALEAARSLVRELGERERASHVVECETSRKCAARLLAADVELVVLDAVSAESIPGAVGLADTGLRLRPQLIVTADSPLATIDQLAARISSPRIAVARPMLRRPRHGFADLARAYGIAGSERIVIDDIVERLAALDAGRCDAVLVDESEIVGRYRALEDTRGALKSVPIMVVSINESESLTAAAKALRARLSDARPAALSIAAPQTAEASYAVNAAARGLMGRPHELVTSDTPLVALANGDVELAIAPADGKSPAAGEEAHAIEAIVTYDRGRGTPMTLWQRAGGTMARADAETLLGASNVARLPDPHLASIWKGRPPTRPREDAARPWLDTTVNALVLAFCAWLVIVLFRRERPGMFDDVSEDA